MQEKIRREDKVKVDMAVVKELLRHQGEVNHYMKTSSCNYRCNLHPKPNLYPCCSCSRFELCKNHKREREYIKSNKESYNTSKRRECKDDKGKMQSEVLDSHEEKQTIYPCEPFDFDCPDKDNCNEGQNCSWKE